MRRLLRLEGRFRSSALIVMAIGIVGLLLSQSNTGAAIDRALSAARFGTVHRIASGRVVVVEMDAQSVVAIKRYPWSRANYAAVVDRLRAAGAGSIVFDVDFASASDPAGDRAFADALARSDGLVALPTFGQAANSQANRIVDALPIAAFRPNVALASVSIAPDVDGQVRSMPFGTMTIGTPRPSLSAYIAQRSGTADTDFPIDMSIDPATIPRLSFIDVREGRFAPAAVRGRNVLIGATAIEMGDRYATPQWGVIPGVIVQALAAETLLRGVPARGSSFVPFLLALLAALWIVRLRSGVGLLIGTIVAVATIVGAVLVAQQVLLLTFPLAAALGMVSTTAVACGVREIAGRFRNQRLYDEATGLPNARSLLAVDAEDAAMTLVVAQVDNHDNLLAVLGSERVGDVILRVSERLALVALEKRLYRTADRQLAFVLPPDEPVDDSLDGLRAVLLQPVEVAGRRVDVAVSIGVATGRTAAVERLLVDAALAAEDASRAGTLWRHSVVDDHDLERSISLMGDLDAALAAGQIEVFYQPKYHLAQRRISSTEALVRWRHLEQGYIGPDTFIPLAERTNRIGPLTLHVLRCVVRDLAGWRMAHADVTAAVNISAKLLSDSGFNATVAEILRTSGVPATALVFEVTESAAMSDPASAIAALERYREMGIAVSMDDYGTGQSTLTYLRQLPLSELKIDRSFVQYAHINRNDGVLVRSTIELAHDLGLKVVAEGVEDAECLDFLKDCGCDLIQGYYISKPVPLPQFLTLLGDDALAA